MALSKLTASIQEDCLIGLEEGVGEFSPGIDGSAIFVKSEAAGWAIVHAPFFHIGHLGSAMGLALLLTGFLGAGGGGGDGAV